MGSKKKYIFYALLIFIIAIQFVQIDKEPPKEDQTLVFSKVESVPTEILTLLNNACYDCHSYNTEYPWYSYVQPIGFWLRSHIRGARQNMNFSEWGTYSNEDKPLILREAAHEIEEGEMPPKSFTMMHPEARLTAEQKEILTEWLKNR